MTEADLNTYKPGGRWERILRATSRYPLSEAEIRAQVEHEPRSRATRKRKVWFTLENLRRLGLIAKIGREWIATARGLQALENGEAG